MDFSVLDDSTESKRESPCPSETCSCSSCEFEIVLRDSETGEVSCGRKAHNGISMETKADEEEIELREHVQSSSHEESTTAEEMEEKGAPAVERNVTEVQPTHVETNLQKISSPKGPSRDVSPPDTARSSFVLYSTPIKQPTKPENEPERNKYGDKYRDIVTRKIQTLGLNEILQQTQAEFQAYCKGWFECETGLSANLIPAESVGEAGEVYLILRKAIHSVEKLYEHCSFLPPADLAEHLISLKRLEPTTLSPSYKEVLADRLAHFALEYENRNADAIEQSKRECFQRIIDAAVIHVEEELRSILDHYAESEHLERICDQVANTTRNNFADSCDLIPDEKDKYLQVLDDHLKSCIEAIKRRNDHLLSKTQADLEKRMEHSCSEYRKFLLEKREKLRSPKWHLALMCGAHQTVMYDALQDFSHKCLQTWPYCPMLCEAARKKFVEKLLQLKQDQNLGMPGHHGGHHHPHEQQQHTSESSSSSLVSVAKNLSGVH